MIAHTVSVVTFARNTVLCHWLQLERAASGVRYLGQSGYVQSQVLNDSSFFVTIIYCRQIVAATLAGLDYCHAIYRYVTDALYTCTISYIVGRSDYLLSTKLQQLNCIACHLHGGRASLLAYICVISKVVVLHKIGEVEKWNGYSIAYRLSDNCTKNYYNRPINIRIMLK